MIKLLIVDDSALMRKHLTRIFEAKGDFTVRTSRNGVEALAEMAGFAPDVVTLDINMPEMDGLTCLSHIMLERPCPVVMVSSLTSQGAMATLEALALGAVDFVLKPSGTISLDIDAIQRDLEEKVRAAARSKVRARAAAAPSPVSRKPRTTRATAVPRPPGSGGVVLIGVSTGGPGTLQDILPLLPESFPWPVVVAQHMPATFTGSFAARLNAICPLRVCEVSASVALEPGAIYIAHGDADIVLSRRAGRPVISSCPPDNRYLWHPSVDGLVESALEVFDARRLIGVLLTGMGNDGARAMTNLHRRGGRTIAESDQTAVVFGMPKELIASGGAGVTLPASAIAEYLTRLLS